MVVIPSLALPPPPLPNRVTVVMLANYQKSAKMMCFEGSVLFLFLFLGGKEVSSKVQHFSGLQNVTACSKYRYCQASDAECFSLK